MRQRWLLFAGIAMFLGKGNMRRSLTCIALLLALTTPLGNEVRGASSSIESELRGLSLCDVVVRGTVQAVRRQMVLGTEFDPGSRLQGYCDVRFITLKVAETLRGDFAGSTIEVAVDVGNSGLAGKYEPGMDLLVGAVSRPDVLSGGYVVKMRYLRNGQEWSDPSCSMPVPRYEIEEIRLAVASPTVSTLTRDSDAILVGVVESVQKDSETDPSSSDRAFYKRVMLNVTRVLKGDSRLKRCEFYTYSGGAYWPEGTQIGPAQIEIGGTYCAFLKDSNGRRMLASGNAGFFAVDEDGGLQRTGFFPAQQRLSVKVDVLSTMIEDEQK